MTQVLHLAGPGDLDKTERMVAAYHALEGFESDEAHRRAALEPLLEGSPHGAVWLIGPKMAPVGYVAVSFGWSIELGGLDGVIDEFWIREAVRGRGMGSEALAALLKALKGAGVAALSLEVAHGNDTAQRLYERAGFSRRDYQYMTWLA
ncbi:MAG: GNAT family N-acetyltransferase [Silicimonas sp.]|jgi:ribosomal protein S18 acetylase RimI-like enzyme|nr:GNAT family N-acetyltransferase [Silicimonas sp.]